MATPSVTGTPQSFNFTTSGTVVTYTGGGATGSNVYDVLCVNSDNVVTTPSGWTASLTVVNNQGSYIFTKAENGTTSATLALGGGVASPTDAIWIRIQNSAGVDAGTATSASANGSISNTTPAFTSTTLGSATDLALAFAALHGFTAGTPTGTAWSSGYTEQANATNGTNAPAVYGSVAIKVPAGTAAETPSFSWTNSTTDRYLDFIAFSPSAGGGASAAPNGISASSALGSPSVSNPENATPSGISSSVTLGSPSVALNRSAAPTGIAATMALGAPNVSSTPGPAGLSLLAALGTPSVSLNLTTAPGGISASAALGTPTASPPSATPTGVIALVVLGTPTVALNRSAAPGGLALVTALGTPSLVQSLTPTGISISALLGAPSVSATVLTAGAPGSWYGIPATDRLNRQYALEERSATSAYCPNDGELLQRNPRTGKMQCSYDGFVRW